MKKFVVCSPAESVSGGPELAHQLCNELNNYEQYDVGMFYYGKGEKKIPKPYSKYNVKLITNIENSNETIMIVPETAIQLFSKYNKVQKIIWWMSVDNFFVTEEEKINKLKKILHIYYDFRKNSNIIHLVQSEYAKQFLLKNNINEKNIFYVSDYLNPLFIEQSKKNFCKEKQDVVLYNPKKGYEITKKIIENCSDIKFIPLINLAREEMVELLSTSKVYIDFGNHPGKDRIPREAAISGCCIITGKRGAAKYYEDVSIPSKFKFDDYNFDMNQLHACILEIFENYNQVITCFDEYRKKIINEESVFKKEVKAVFDKIYKGV